MAKIGRYIALLGVLLAVVAAAAGYVAARRYGPEAYQASAVAAALNWFAGSAALTIAGLSASQPWRVQGALVGMLVRMAVPLAAVMFFAQNRPPLASHGVVMLIVVHYLVGLLVETVLTVRMVAAATQPTSGSPGLTSGPQPPAAS